MQTNATKAKPYFTVILVNSPSFPVYPTASVAIAIDYGETSLANTPLHLWIISQTVLYMILNVKIISIFNLYLENSTAFLL